MCKPMVSLCMPTNGVIEWVFPVLDSIYEQGVDERLFEVVVTDNGNNIDFASKMNDYLNKHSNIIYAKTDALPFINEIESYKRANGELIKFVNHRTILLRNSLQRLIDFVEENREEKPIAYFTNGMLGKNERTICDDFDSFVRTLSYWSSWSTGMTIWRSDFEKLPEDVIEYNELFPHTTVLFKERNRGKYIIDDSVIFYEMPQGKRPKGNYDLFSAFGIEYPWIICTLLRDGDISSNTFRTVIKKNGYFIGSMYWAYCVRRKYCSYDLSGEENMYGVFYSKKEIKRAAYRYGVEMIVSKMKK